jgi:hypothetical protein
LNSAPGALNGSEPSEDGNERAEDEGAA